MSEVRKEYRRFNAVGTQQIVPLNPSSQNQLQSLVSFSSQRERSACASVIKRERIFMVRVADHNEINQNDRPIGISFRQRIFYLET